MERRSIKGASGVYVLSHPVRAAIVKVLRRKGNAYIAQIARELALSERLVSFHLSILATAGFVESEYALSNPVTAPPRVVKYYRLTPKVDETFSQFVAALKK
ncbi:MAG: winged helix-turn-helix domain-containing protein [Chloroflexota bacterium]|nr:winged helix-turn-helix domain-containing protein [Chloroflexota bacterium]